MTNHGVDRAGLASNIQSNESAQRSSPGAGGLQRVARLPFRLTLGIEVSTSWTLSLPALCRGQGKKHSPASENLFSGQLLSQIVPGRTQEFPQRPCWDR